MSFVLYCGAFLLSLFAWIALQGLVFGKTKQMDIPGPKGWLLVGNALQMDPHYPYKTLLKWRMKYGGMFKIRVFKNITVVLNDYESIKEMFNSKACSSRPHMFRVHGIGLKGIKDIIFSNISPEWSENKKALSRALNAYGTGLRKVENITMECIDKLLSDIQEDTNDFTRNIDLKPHIHKCIVGTVIILFSGRKLAESELMKLLELEKGMVEFASPAGLVAVLDHFPWIRHLPFKGLQEPIKAAADYLQWVIQRLEEWKSSLNEESILYSLMQHINKVTSKPLTAEELIGVTHNIFSAGFLTSTASLYALILILLNFPDIQEKMYCEIQSVTRGRRPKVSDCSSMPYVKAVMEENLRFASILPIPSIHHAGEDTTISGKYIPKGTNLLANIWALHHDEQYFDDPWQFKPERYLDVNGQILTCHASVCKHTMSFGGGRRGCSGEGLARNRTFLVIASLLQKYKFLPENENQIPSCDPREYKGGIVVAPFKYKVKVVERQMMK